VSDRERLARLAKLARRAWAKQRVDVIADAEGVSVERCSHLLEDCGTLAQIEHPRALDALEAALMALVDGASQAGGSDWHRGFAAGRRYEIALANESARKGLS
jgi:hypothetical protein